MNRGELFPLAGLMCLMVGTVDAQRPAAEGRDNRPALAVLGGPAPYDLAGTGTGGFGALRIEFPSGRYFVIEPGVSVFRYRSQLDEAITYILPELSVQAQVPGGALRPYAGGGIGFSEFLSGRGSNDLTLHAVGGFRADVANGWGLRAEARLRSIDPFAGSTVDLGFGITRRLRSAP